MFCTYSHRVCKYAQVEGNGFLYKQVRHLVGAMLTAGRGRLTLDAISAKLELGSARPPGASAQVSSQQPADC